MCWWPRWQEAYNRNLNLEQHPKPYPTPKRKTMLSRPSLREESPV